MHFLFPNKIWKLPQSIQVCQTKEHAQFDVDIGIQKSDWMGLNVIESNIKYKNWATVLIWGGSLSPGNTWHTSTDFSLSHDIIRRTLGSLKLCGVIGLHRSCTNSRRSGYITDWKNLFIQILWSIGKGNIQGILVLISKCTWNRVQFIYDSELHLVKYDISKWSKSIQIRTVVQSMMERKNWIYFIA